MARLNTDIAQIKKENTILGINAVLVIIAAGVAVYLIRKKLKTKKSKGLAAPKENLTEIAQQECEKSLSNVRMTEQGKAEYMENCISSKLNA